MLNSVAGSDDGYSVVSNNISVKNVDSNVSSFGIEAIKPLLEIFVIVPLSGFSFLEV